MKTQTEEIDGKTIFSHRISDGSLLLSFTDGTFAVIRGARYYDSDIILEFDDFYWEEWDCLVKLEICSQEELDAMSEAVEDERTKRARQDELNEFNRLKAKLGL